MINGIIYSNNTDVKVFLSYFYIDERADGIYNLWAKPKNYKW